MASFTLRAAGTGGKFGFLGEQENLLSLWAIERPIVTTLTELRSKKLTVSHLFKDFRSLKTGHFLSALETYCLTVP